VGLPAPGDPRRALALFLCFAGLSLLTRWLSLVIDVLDTDEAAHSIGSWVLLDGGLLYRDFVDNKPPGLYAYYALVQILFGRGLLPVHLFTALVVVPLTALAASAFFGHDRRGVAAGVLHLLYGSAFLAHDMLAAHAELILLLPASWAMVAVADERRARRFGPLAGAGLLLGLATLVKHQAALWVPAAAGAAVVATGSHAPSRRLVAPLAVGLSFLLPLALAGAWFLAAGTWPDLVYWTLLRNLVYTANPIPGREAAERAASYLLPWLLATSPLWWSWLRSRPILDAHRGRLLDALVVLSLLLACLGLRFYPHYFVPAGFVLAVGAAPAVAEWLVQPRSRSFRWFAAATVVLVAGFQVANAWLYLGGLRVYRETDPVYEATARRLARDPCFPGSRLFVWGWAPIFYYRAGLLGVRPASRFSVMAQAGLTGYISGNLESLERDEAEGTSVHWDWLFEDLERTPATYILDTAPAGLYRWDRFPLADYPRLAAYVRGSYELLDTVGAVRLYRRRDCVAPGAKRTW
jgi:hypothetical protein